MSAAVIEINDNETLEQLKSKHPDFLAVAFVSDASARSTDALRTLKKIHKSPPLGESAVAVVNVSKNRDIHGGLGVTAVPTVLTFKSGKVLKKLEGLQTEETYRKLLSDAPRKTADGKTAPPLRVTVYTTRTCPHCTTVKNHLRRSGIPYREVDVSRDEGAAIELTRRTGQTGVPQTDINGTFVLGADLTKINRLVGLGPA